MIKNRKLSIGSWITFSNEASAEIMAKAGFDWLVIDMEHAPMGIEAASRVIRVIDLAGTKVFCRLPSNDINLAKTLLDAGAKGIIVPSVESVQDAEKAVSAVYYPPKGKRGVGLGRAHAYGSAFEEYRKKANDELTVIAMIETLKGVENVEAIASTSGIDGLLIGPYDLSGSLGVIGQLEHQFVKNAAQKVLDTAKKAGIGCGLHVVHPSIEKIKISIKDGYTFLALGVDMILLDQSARNVIRMAKF